MKFSVLASGSKGNATLITTGRTTILLDFGVSARKLSSLLHGFGLDPASLNAILVSHEHTDHVSGLPVFLKRHAVPLYTTVGTWEHLPLGEIRHDHRPITTGEPFTVGDLEIHPVSISHDASDPCGFVFRSGSTQIAQVTDLGCMTELVRHRLQGSHALILESNHDVEMLRVGPYPWQLKQRVLSRIGHLSNTDLAHFLEHDFDGLAKRIVLAHLSQQNNHPEISRQSAWSALSRRFGNEDHRIELLVASQDEPTPLLEIL